MGYDWQSEANGIARAHYAVALKRSNAPGRTEIIPALLNDDDSEVRFVGIKWIADEKLSQYESQLKSVLNRSDLSRRDLRAVVAALSRISSDSKKEFSPDETLLELALDTDKPSALRAMALANVKIDHPRLTIANLTSLARSKEHDVRLEAVRSLALHADAARAQILAEIAVDTTLDVDLRADAIAGQRTDRREQQVSGIDQKVTNLTACHDAFAVVLLIEGASDGGWQLGLRIISLVGDQSRRVRFQLLGHRPQPKSMRCVRHYHGQRVDRDRCRDQTVASDR